MRKLFLLLTISFSIVLNVNCQDTITNIDIAKPKNKFVDKIVAIDSSKFLHIVDFRTPFGEGIGYNLVYQLNNRFGVGGRFGMWYIIKNPTYQFSIDGFSQVRVWKSCYLQLGVGYSNSYSKYVAGGMDNGKYTFGDSFYLVSLETKIIVFNHFLLGIGAVKVFDAKPKNWYTTARLTLGYKF
jgi:hypothetical protein